MNKYADRRVEQTLAIDAPVDAVWKALTDATELTRWFPLAASVIPGAGGVIRMGWDESYDADSAIEIWEPNRHLRIGFPHHPPVLLATDYHLESTRGRTILRVVTSGFGEGSDWDDWYSGVSAGWDFELRGLKHYLEHHRGEDRMVASARHPLSIPRESAWDRLTGRGGWLEHTGLSGSVLVRTPPVQLVMSVDQLNDGILRVELEFGNRVIAWLATWGVPRATIDTINVEWQRTLPAALA
ncbi:MAG TPA: SRPBCC domain-containing protein [Gemmatimonadales bacterium]|nr:SRPBCC domain-containing protein [Gemmatimonadales bacterium]